MTSPTQNWHVEKPAARGPRGMVVSQNIAAARIGADILAAGGNAIDAAVATGFALAPLEPWNSGLGGIGFMVVWHAKSRSAHVVDFGPVAPRRLDPAAFPLTGSGTAGDLFGWPRVADDRNVHGPLSIAVPGEVDGLGLAHERFGSLPWPRLLEPAIAEAERGLPVDWYTTLRIATSARDIARYSEAASMYLPGGFAPVTLPGAERVHVAMPALAETLRRLAIAGRRDFYEGAIARKIAGDAEAAGAVLRADDLASYAARMVEPLAFRYRGVDLLSAGALTAGPTLARALGAIGRSALSGDAPDADAFATYAEALNEAYSHRFEHMGAARDAMAPSCTTHLNVVDGEGNFVSLTQTLLSVFGSKVLLPATGILMNNGVMWFDPRPGRANSMAPGRRPLSNMCPVVAVKDGAPWMALGASGGRKIVSAVTQLLSFLIDFRMPLERACHQPRIDASGEAEIRVDPRLDAGIRDALGRRFRTRPAEHTVLPVNYACPCVIVAEPGSGTRIGMGDVMSPWSGAAAEAS
jgi:gamma-glutamyltranspeptidase/glutathione hydrolase